MAHPPAHTCTTIATLSSPLPPPPLPRTSHAHVHMYAMLWQADARQFEVGTIIDPFDTDGQTDG
jgi:hypothetical protein